MDVVMPDGTLITDVPDSISRAELFRRYRGSQPESTLSDSLKALAYAPGKAAVGLAGFTGDAADLARMGKEKINSYLPDWARNADQIAGIVSPLSQIGNLMPRSAPLRAAAEQVTGPWYEPQTRTGKIVDTAAQAATTFGRSLATKPLQSLPVITGITAGTEGAGALSGDNPWIRMLGALVGGGIPAGMQAMRSRPGVILKDALGAQTPGQIAQARAMEQQAVAQGVPLLGTESLDAGHQLAAAVLAHPAGNKILEQFLKQRPAQVETAAKRGLLAPTGPIDTPANNAARAQQAATDVISNAERARTASVSPFYQAAAGETLPAQALRPVANELQNLMFQAPNASTAERALGGWHKQLFPYDPPAPESIASIGKAKSGVSIQVNPNQDDIITAIRKLGGMTPKDESIGSLAKAMPFPPDPRFGPVWRQSEYRGSTSTVTRAGHSPDRMAELLHEKGYLENRDGLGELMSKVEDAALGSKQHFSMFRDQGGTDPLANAIEKLVKQMEVKNAPKIGAENVAPNAVLPETNVGRLNEIYKALGIERDLPSIGATSEQKIASFPAGKMQDALGDVLKQASPNTAKAQALYAQITREKIDPLKAGPVGLVAGKTGVDPAAASPVPRVISTISDSNTVRPDTIRTLYTNLNKVDKQAFPGIVQTHVENQINASLEKIRSGPNPTAGAKLAQALVGTPQDVANFNEMMRGVAQAHGANPDAVVRGANNLLQVLERTGRTPGIGSPTAGRGEISKEMGKTLITDTLGMISLTPTKPLAHRMSDWIQRGRYEGIAKALTAPSSVDALARLAKLDPRSVTAQYYAVMLLGLDKAIAGGP